MITRLLLSLKKANASQEQAWSLGEPSAHTPMGFAEHRSGAITRDETRLDTFASTHEVEHDDVKEITGDFIPSQNAGGLDDLISV